MKHDIGQIAKMLADRAEDVCRWLLPSGRKKGGQWRVGSVHGDEGESLRVDLGYKAGIWKDFADDGKGGDLIDLITACTGVSKADAVKTAKEYLGIRDDGSSFRPKKKTYALPAKPKCCKPVKAVSEFFEGRGISKETFSAFRIGENGNVIVFPYFHGDKVKLIKFRDSTDKSRMWSSKDSEPVLFGWQTVPDNLRRIVITEGEIDAMSFYQQGVHALSLPFGGGSGDKQDNWIENEYDNLQLFDTIYLALDMDAQGNAARDHLLERLGRHRCKVIDFSPYKDANEALMKGGDLKQYINSAKHCDPPELRPATDFIAEMLDYYYYEKGVLEGYTLPWPKTHNLFRIRHSEISLWAGINGHGKSQVLGHIVIDSMSQGEKWCIASMEMKPRSIMWRMFRQASGISRPDPDLCYTSGSKYIEERLFLVNEQGTVDGTKIMSLFEYAYRRFGCTSFLVDSLAKAGFAEDDYNSQKSFIDNLMAFAHRCNVHVHIICHSRKLKSENDIPGKMDIKGTGALADMVDNVFTVWRDKKENRKDGKPDCIIECSKQRNGEWEGRILLWFDPASYQYKAEIGYLPKQYIKPKSSSEPSYTEPEHEREVQITEDELQEDIRGGEYPWDIGLYY
jgi:twinkle protein